MIKTKKPVGDRDTKERLYMKRAGLSVTLPCTPTSTATNPNILCCYYRINRLQLVCWPFQLSSSFNLVKYVWVCSSLHLLNCFFRQSEKKDQSMKTFVLQSFCPLLHSSLPTAGFSFALKDWAEASNSFIKCFFVFSPLQGSNISVGFVVYDDLSKF